MHYRRAKTSGATYFFTVVTYNRQPVFCSDETIALLRQAFHTVKAESPFAIDAIAVLPDHIYSIWTLPEGDADFSSLACDALKLQSLSRRHKGEQAVWQRRFWEHQIRNEADFDQHVDYIHYNPVKHGLVDAPRDWPYSSFHRYVKDGTYPADWGATEAMEFDEKIGRE